MERIETEIIIPASADAVWKVLTDFESYPQWNPFIKSIKGEPKVGSTLATTIVSKGDNTQSFKPRVLKAEPGVEFRWLGRLFVPGLFDGEHFFQIEPISENEVRFIHGENFRGVLVGAIMSSIREDVKAGFNAMNEALKAEVAKRSIPQT